MHLLGPFQLLRHGHSLDTRNGAKSFRVLKYLLAHRHQPIVKDVLIDLFWPDCDFDSVGRNLHQAIYTLRKLLRDGGPDRPYVLFENDAYLLDPGLSIWCDAEEMEAGAAAGRSAEQAGDLLTAAAAYERATGCYAGEYLADSPYEEWALSERERLRLFYVDVANRLGELRLGMGDVEAAAAVSRQLLRHETCDEDAHRRLIRCYGAAGHRTMVVRQYRAYVECAERMYGVDRRPRRPGSTSRSSPTDPARVVDGRHVPVAVRARPRRRPCRRPRRSRCRRPRPRRRRSHPARRRPTTTTTIAAPTTGFSPMRP